MKHACLVLCFGWLPAICLSAPPLRCDDVPPAVTFPQSPYARTIVPLKEPVAPVADPSRRQRIQSLKDRVNELKSKFENPPPPPVEDAEPPLLIEPSTVMPENSPPDQPHQSTSPLPETTPFLVDLEQATEPVPEPIIEEPTPQPDSPRPLPSIPEPETPLPATSASEIPQSHEDSPLTLPTELLDQAIDRQRMGNNLYAIGAYELALMNYEKMQQLPLSAVEAQWVQFQVANCQRHLGQTALAQKAYRRVAGETSEDWLGQMSRWWLKELDDREQLQRRVAELDQIIKTIEQEVRP